MKLLILVVLVGFLSGPGTSSTESNTETRTSESRSHSKRDKSFRVLTTDLNPELKQPSAHELVAVCEQLLFAIQLQERAFKVQPWVYQSGLAEIVDEYEAAMLTISHAKADMERFVCSPSITSQLLRELRIQQLTMDLKTAEDTIELLIEFALSEN